MTVTEILETNPEKLETFDPNKECYRDPLLLGKIGDEYAILAQW